MLKKIMDLLSGKKLDELVDFYEQTKKIGGNISYNNGIFCVSHRMTDSGRLMGDFEYNKFCYYLFWSHDGKNVYRPISIIEGYRSTGDEAVIHIRDVIGDYLRGCKYYRRNNE